MLIMMTKKILSNAIIKFNRVEDFELCGMMCFMPHYILVPPCIGKEIIHSVWRQKLHEEKGVLHCVIPQNLADAVNLMMNESEFLSHTKRTRPDFQ